MQANRQRLSLVAAALALALALAGAAVAAVAAGSSAAKATVRVTEREYHIALSATSVKAGSVTFSVHNAGKLVHKVDLSGGGLKSTVKMPAIRPGTTKSVTVTLAGGKLSLWCPVPGHAALGMKTSLKISGGTGAAGGTSSTSSGGGWG